MLKGKFNHTIDAKGRLIMPAKLRDSLGEKFVVTKGLDGCLYGYSIEEWENIESKFREIPLSSKDTRKFARFFFANAADCEIDKQGRTLIPSELREFAGIGKDVVLVGVLNKIEIWSKEKWLGEDITYEDMDEAAEHMAELGVGF